jgi:hypothetical protein
VTQLVLALLLPLHEATIEPLHAAVESAFDPTAIESAVEPLHVAADPAVVGAALTETSYLCVWV